VNTFCVHSGCCKFHLLTYTYEWMRHVICIVSMVEMTDSLPYLGGILLGHIIHQLIKVWTASHEYYVATHTHTHTHIQALPDECYLIRGHIATVENNPYYVRHYLNMWTRAVNVTKAAFYKSSSLIIKIIINRFCKTWIYVVYVTLINKLKCKSKSIGLRSWHQPRQTQNTRGFFPKVADNKRINRYSHKSWWIYKSYTQVTHPGPTGSVPLTIIRLYSV